MSKSKRGRRKVSHDNYSERDLTIIGVMARVFLALTLLGLFIVMVSLGSN